MAAEHSPEALGHSGKPVLMMFIILSGDADTHLELCELIGVVNLILINWYFFCVPSPFLKKMQMSMSFSLRSFQILKKRIEREGKKHTKKGSCFSSSWTISKEPSRTDKFLLQSPRASTGTPLFNRNLQLAQSKLNLNPLSLLLFVLSKFLSVCSIFF